MKRKYKVYNHNLGPYYFDLESSMKERVMMIVLGGSDVNVFNQHEEKFIRMTEGTRKLRNLISRNHEKLTQGIEQ